MRECVGQVEEDELSRAADACGGHAGKGVSLTRCPPELRVHATAARGGGGGLYGRTIVFSPVVDLALRVPHNDILNARRQQKMWSKAAHS